MPDRELGVGDQNSGIKLKVTDAKGPKIGGNSYWLCQNCNKVVYSIYRDGPLADDTRNRVFCTCEGIQDMGNQKMLVNVVGVEDVANPQEVKEFREWLKTQ